MNSYNTGLAAAFLTTLSWSVGTFSFTKATRLMLPQHVNQSRLLFAFILLSILTCLFTYIDPVQLFTAPYLHNWIYLGLSGFIGLTLGDQLFFNTLKILGARRGSLFQTFAPGSTLLFGYFILGERINWLGLLGIAISIAGVMWLVLSKAEKDSVTSEGYGNITNGILCGIGFAICQGLGLVLASKGMTLPGETVPMNALHATWIRMTLAVITAFAFALILKEKIVTVSDIKKSGSLIYLLAGTAYGPVIGVTLCLYASARIEVSVAQTIFSLIPVVVLFISTLVLGRENINRNMILGAIIAILGVAILVWRDQLQQLMQF
jgi:drug/metabolite transporter (DMT)-like permease